MNDYVHSDILTGAADFLLRKIPTYREFCANITVADGRQAGQPLSVEGHPAQEALITAFDSGKWRRFAWAKPVQDGGTLIMLVPLFRRAVVENQTVVLAYPTVDAAKDIWTTKIWPVLAAYGGQQPERGGGSKGGAARVVTLPSGGKFILRAAGGRGESGQASITGDALGVDEVDDWPNLHRVELISQRINESQDPIAVYCCTVKRDGIIGQPDGSLILSLVEEGTDGRLEYPCPGCGAYYIHEWEAYDVEAGAYRCICGHLWGEKERLEAFRNWRLVHKNEDNSLFSMRWSALDSPRKTMAELCNQYKRAEKYKAAGDHGPMRSFYRDRLTRPYRGDVETDDNAPAKLTRLSLVARSQVSKYALTISERSEDGDSKHFADVSGMNISYGALGVDVQRGGERAPGRLYYVLDGITEDGTIVPSAWGNIRLSGIGQQPSVIDLHDGLDRLYRLFHPEGQDSFTFPFPLVRCCVDVGDRQDELVPWIIKHRGWCPVKGTKGDMSANLGDVPGWWFGRRQDAGWTLYHVPTYTVMAAIHGAITLQPGQPGAFLLPRGLDTNDAMIRHLVGTVQIRDAKRGLRWSDSAKDRQAHPEFQQRIDYFQCHAYAYAGAYAWRRNKQRAGSVKRRFGNLGKI